MTIEKKKSFWDKLKNRWGIDSNIQVIIILVVFAITGTSSLYVKNLVFDLIGINPETPLWLKTILYIIIIIPAYQVLLICWGTIFGQFRFFKNFLLKMLSRFKRKKAQS